MRYKAQGVWPEWPEFPYPVAKSMSGKVWGARQWRLFRHRSRALRAAGRQGHAFRTAIAASPHGEHMRFNDGAQAAGSDTPRLCGRIGEHCDIARSERGCDGVCRCGDRRRCGRWFIEALIFNCETYRPSSPVKQSQPALRRGNITAESPAPDPVLQALQEPSIKMTQRVHTWYIPPRRPCLQ